MATVDGMTAYVITLRLTAALAPREAEDWAAELVSDAHDHLHGDDGEALELVSVAVG